METTAYIALARQGTLRREMDVIANNLANMNTTAFKGQNMMFVEHLVKSRGGNSFIPEKLAFVRDVAEYRDFRDGPTNVTNNPLDVALKDGGYFVVDTPDGEQYTRNGRFQPDADGQLVTEHGFPVLSTAGTPIFFSPEDTDIHISRDGTISTNNGELGRIRVVTFANENELQKNAGSLYSTDQSPEDAETPSVIQGALEGSNVEPIIELTRMIDVHRAYESVKTLIQKEDDRQRKMIETLGARA